MKRHYTKELVIMLGRVSLTINFKMSAVHSSMPKVISYMLGSFSALVSVGFGSYILCDSIYLYDMFYKSLWLDD